MKKTLFIFTALGFQIIGSICMASKPITLQNTEGDLVSIWRTTRERGDLIMACKKPLEGNWNQPVTLSNPNLHSRAVKFKMNDQGYGVAIWISSNQEYRSLYACEYDGANDRWTHPELMFEYSLGNSSIGGLSVDIDDQYNMQIMWTISEEGKKARYISTKMIGKNWSTSTLPTIN